MSPPPPTPPPAKAEGRRKASGFRYWLDVQTRWIDNDQYGHINNAVYYLAADAAINAYLVSHCALQPYRQPTDPPPSDPRADVLGLMISTSAIYYAPATFPCVLRVGLRVIKLGQSSVTYELGMFEMPDPTKGQGLPALEGGKVQAPAPGELDGEALAGTLTRATHVYVDRQNRRPVRPMPEAIGKGLQAVRVEEWAEDGEGKARL
ncbi:hypothetical protein BDZ90DRAFT_260730 [Jaminaea rosea]|uniref:Thioesterase domain-containing protein n=1 Tax=Jaminaea rosea TaxID=1569628 RepID=A0A316UP43_9BASI|nr:hypothetical protein BDZ90DRAFT_260730 [Jaminaea rosea]PWN27057.1 hypothetical protein BDZ90DRAFT_260730 [Jaminaea rosea]